MLAKKFRLLIQKLPAKPTWEINLGDGLVVRFFKSELGFSRTGVVISKKAASGAVARNHLKRLVFEAAKNIITKIQPGDYLLIVRKKVSNRSLEDNFKKLIKPNV